jgi:outer membrane protein OmpA-like peptidoglycan-associated protein
MMLKRFWQLSLCVFYFNAQNIKAQQIIKLENPSFEDMPQVAHTPKGWVDCGDPNETPPDIQPNPTFQVYKSPKQGKSYLGMVARDNETWEAIGQRLKAPLQAGRVYQFNLSLCKSTLYVSKSKRTGRDTNYDNPLIVRIWGGDLPCVRSELLQETVPVSNTDWQTYYFEFRPKANHNYILIEAVHKRPTILPCNGNVLIDNASDLVGVPTSEETLRDSLEKIEKRRLAQIKKDSLEKVRLAQIEKNKKARLAQLEKDNLEKKRLAQLEKDNLEKMHLAQMEKNSLEKVRLAQMEKDSLEKVLLAQLEKDSLEKVRLAQMEKDSLEKVRLAQMEKDSLEKVRLAQMEKDSLEKVRLAQMEKDSLEKTKKTEQEPKIGDVKKINIQFEANLAMIQPQYHADLDSIYNFLVKYSTLVVEIGGHTNRTCGDCVALSEKRAKSVFDYWVQKGIQKTRLQIKGYGSEMPISEHEKLNQRVEIKILRMN